jgi:hypothetical protein
VKVCRMDAGGMRDRTHPFRIARRAVNRGRVCQVPDICESEPQ